MVPWKSFECIALGYGAWAIGILLWIINIEVRAEVMEKYGLLKIEINAKQVSFKFRVVSIGAIKTSY